MPFLLCSVERHYCEQLQGINPISSDYVYFLGSDVASHVHAASTQIRGRPTESQTLYINGNTERDSDFLS